MVELYDKGCQADLGGTTTAGGVAGEGGDDSVGAQSTSTSTSAASLKKTPDKRRNHLRYFGLTDHGAARSCPYSLLYCAGCLVHYQYDMLKPSATLSFFTA